MTISDNQLIDRHDSKQTLATLANDGSNDPL